jgi:hypothetical protein
MKILSDGAFSNLVQCLALFLFNIVSESSDLSEEKKYLLLKWALKKSKTIQQSISIT